MDTTPALPPSKIVKKIFDEVHGYIEITDVEKELIDTPIFQRLRFIKQLAAAWLVYPGATHTRFSHSLGAMHVMGMVASRLYSIGYISNRDDVQLLRIAALLHDIGHMPYSHATELYYRKKLGIGHEDLSELIVRENPDIKAVLINYGFDPQEVVAVMRGRHREPLYNQLVSGDLDVDRIDYLLRDSLHTGVAYGVIDIHRIVSTLCIDGEGNLAILEKGLEAVENFYLARLYMYRAVYYHKTIVGFEILIRKIYEELSARIANEFFFTSMSEIRRAIRDGSIVFWNDAWLYGVMVRALRDPNIDENVKELIRMFLSRRGYKTVIDLSKMVSDSEEEVRHHDLENIVEKLRGIGIDDVEVFVDDIKIVDDVHVQPRVILRRGASVPVSMVENSVVKTLPRKFLVRRIYVLDRYVAKARDLVRKIGLR